MFHSLRGRLFFSHALVIFVSLLITGTGMLYVLREFGDLQLERQLTTGLRGSTSLATQLVRQGASPQNIVTAIQDQSSGQFRVLLLDERNQVVADSKDEFVGRSFPRLQNRQVVIAGRTIYFVSANVNPANTPRRTLVFASVDRPFIAGLEEITLPIISSAIVTLFISLVLAFGLARSISDPLRRLERATDEIARGNYEHQVPITGQDEVSLLARRFNAMALAVKRSQQMQKDLVANVSHELKTPLTSIKGFAQAIVEGAVHDLDSARHAAETIYEESLRMARLIGELLTLARLEAGESNTVRETVPLDQLVPHWVERLRPLANEAEVKLSVEAHDVLPILGDAGQIEQVILNLVENAIKYNHPGGTVTVSAMTDGAPPQSVRAPLNGENSTRWSIVHVADTGPGIPQEHLPHLFERFYRADKARVAGGAGLGLAITQEIVHAHHGEILVESEAGKGSTFSVYLPSKE